MCYHVVIQTIDDVINFITYPQSSSKAIAEMEETSGRWKYQGLNILRTKRAFEIKGKAFFL